MDEIYKLFKDNFSFINREEKVLKEVINNKDNIIFKEEYNNKLIGCSIVNKNTILLLVVSKDFRNKGIGSSLLKKSEDYIIKNNYNKIVLGVGFNYLMPGVPTSKKYCESVCENLYSFIDDNASNFFEKRGYIHSWKDCNCFDMIMDLKDFTYDNNIGDSINNILYRWANINDIDAVIKCADDACIYQDEKFSKYYKNNDLYNPNNNQKVLIAEKDNKIVGCLIVSIETENKDLGSVGCTCVVYSETHKKIGTNMVRIGTKYLKDMGMKKASLSYTYTGLDKLYGASGYEICTYYFMGEKKVNNI